MLFGVVAQIREGQHNDRQPRRGWRIRKGGRGLDTRRLFTVLTDLADKAHALAVHGANDTLRRAAVIDRLPSRIEARRQCRVGDNAPAPNAVYQIVLADDPATIAHQIDKKIEHLRFERDGLGPAAQFAPLDIEHVIAKSENHPRSPRLGPSGLFLREKQALRKRQSHLKGESGASQSLSFGIRAFLPPPRSGAPLGRRENASYCS